MTNDSGLAKTSILLQLLQPLGHFLGSVRGHAHDGAHGRHIGVKAYLTSIVGILGDRSVAFPSCTTSTVAEASRLLGFLAVFLAGFFTAAETAVSDISSRHRECVRMLKRGRLPSFMRLPDNP